MKPEIPQTWAELQQQGQQAIKVLETVMKVPVPASIKDAVDGKWMESSAGLTRDILGRTTRAEKKEWRKRVIKLSDANEILKNLENQIVQNYILASASPLRIALDGIILIPKWVVKHIAELTLILLPLFLTSVEKSGDVVMIERRITEIEKEIARYERMLPTFYEQIPDADDAPPVSVKGGGPTFTVPAITKASLRESIKVVEDAIAELKREKTALAGLSVKAGTVVDLAVAAFSVTIAFLTVSQLLRLGQSMADVFVTTGPAGKLRDEAIELAKSKSLPQFSGGRKVVKKRSRRN